VRQRILKHAFVILTVAFALGLVVGASHGAHHDVAAKAWLVSHVTGIIVSVLIAIVGLLWGDLRLGPRAAQVLFWATVPGNYLVMLILGIVLPAMGIAPALAVPEGPAPAGLGQTLLVFGIVLATITSFVMSGLVLYGLRSPSRIDDRFG
jgi:hypothetical protein